MRVTVRLFAAARERAGCDRLELDLPDGATVADAVARLASDLPPLAAILPYCQTAVNQAMADAQARLSTGDELALLPPVAGGQDRLARLVDGSPSLDACLRAVTGPDMGGIVTFTGVVRRHSQGRDVIQLEYEAYREMAERVFRALCDEIEGEWPGVRVALEHATGTLRVGDVAVVMAAAAPHRAEAFAACQALIDRLKERAPIWKKELGPDGAIWVGLGP
jgi:molybdopterin converting factor subunit 1